MRPGCVGQEDTLGVGEPAMHGPVYGNAISTYVAFPSRGNGKVLDYMRRGTRHDMMADTQAEAEGEVNHNNPPAVVGVGRVHDSDNPLEEDIGTHGGMREYPCVC